MRRVAALSMELNVSASELVRMLLQLPSEGAARIDAVERARRRPGSRDVGERLRPPNHKADQAPRSHGACELGLDVVGGGFEVIRRRSS